MSTTPQIVREDLNAVFVKAQNGNKTAQQKMDRFIRAMAAFVRTDDFARVAGLHGGGWGIGPQDSAPTKNLTAHAAFDLDARKKIGPLSAGANPDYGFCWHGREQFPTWHRAYVAEFEHLLQQHDPLKKGHNQADSLPLMYFNWTTEQYPAILSDPTYTFFDKPAERIDNPLASGYTLGRPPMGAWTGDGRVPTRRNRPADITRTLAAYEVALVAQEAYKQPKYLLFSHHRQDGESLEDPHDSVHGAIGGDMGFVPRAAFDPIFWLHHCEVEHQFTAWQHKFGGTAKIPKPSQDYFKAPMAPFASSPKLQAGQVSFTFKPSDATPVATCEQWWDPTKLTYTFDDLPSSMEEAAAADDAAPPRRAHRHMVSFAATMAPLTLSRGGATVRIAPKKATISVKVKKGLPPGEAALFLGDRPLARRFIFSDATKNGDRNCPNCQDADEHILHFRVDPQLLSGAPNELRQLKVTHSAEPIDFATECELCPINDDSQAVLGATRGRFPERCQGKEHSLAASKVHSGGLRLRVGVAGTRVMKIDGFESALHDAMQFWEFATTTLEADVGIHFEFCEGTDVDIVISSERISGDKRAAATTSHHKGGAVHLFLNSDEAELWQNKDTLEAMLTHLLGHALGLPHSEDRNSVMYADPSSRSKLTADVKKQLVSILTQ